ncbi:hypothetical protein [Bradyrhizobium septentrionale]|uniref:Alkaline phytoceramidase n=1 Tax=Bradyrhizobium septentrionale TaxID=1404411 RepID=A0A974A0G3_9BRAD|nr:hypothetical protein [Bradyrhizobium septentrionale]UGY14047.1 hypothetical protein HAP48_0036620 [Bradyrhizobium septentrionale]UGY22602.1 hypothetical protein HU675_0032120 [Bradyrhizobium septentrionale]
MQTTSWTDGSIGPDRPVKPWIKHAPTIVTTGAIVILALYGRIAQPADYNDFADRSDLFGIHHAADVFSNAGFALVAIWGWLALRPRRNSDQLRAGWPGYRLFLIGLFLTAFGSAYYHLDPGNARLIWDRLPIALACAGLLVGVRGGTRPGLKTDIEAIGLGLFAVASVAWWVITDRHGADDLRPYLLLQVLPLILIPLWQSIYRAPRADRTAFATAMVLYILAKITEVLDHQIAGTFGFVSGHTLKHLIATAATAAVVWGLTRRFSAGGRRLNDAAS